MPLAYVWGNRAHEREVTASLNSKPGWDSVLGLLAPKPVSPTSCPLPTQCIIYGPLLTSCSRPDAACQGCDLAASPGEDQGQLSLSHLLSFLLLFCSLFGSQQAPGVWHSWSPLPTQESSFLFAQPVNKREKPKAAQTSRLTHFHISSNPAASASSISFQACPPLSVPMAMPSFKPLSLPD